SSSKQRRICAIASTSRRRPRNWLPRPCPCDAPRTSPAISTNSSCVGIIFADLARRAHTASRPSRPPTRPPFPSPLENGYFVASAACVAVSALNRADLPTFGRPTMPQLKPISLPHKDVMTGLGPVIHERDYFVGRQIRS